MHYEVLYNDILARLENKVNKYIEMGYKPQGGIFVVKGLWCQAMIRETKS